MYVCVCSDSDVRILCFGKTFCVYVHVHAYMYAYVCMFVSVVTRMCVCCVLGEPFVCLYIYMYTCMYMGACVCVS